MSPRYVLRAPAAGAPTVPHLVCECRVPKGALASVCGWCGYARVYKDEAVLTEQQAIEHRVRTRLGE